MDFTFGIWSLAPCQEHSPVDRLEKETALGVPFLDQPFTSCLPQLRWREEDAALSDWQGGESTPWLSKDKTAFPQVWPGPART